MDAKNVVDSQLQAQNRVDKGLAAAAIIQSIPRILWVSLVTVLGGFLVLALWFNHNSLETFTSNVLLWIARILIATGVVLLSIAAYKCYKVYHTVMMQRYERRNARAVTEIQQLRVEKQRLQNEQLNIRLDLERTLPDVLRYAIAAGHNVEYDGKGLKVLNYLSNVHTLNPANDKAMLTGPDGTNPAQVPTFAELLEDGTIQAAIAKGKMLLGYTTDGQPRYGSWLDLYSSAIGGVSGSGKSTTVRFLLFQAVLAGAKLIMVDPHIGDEDESLAAQFRQFGKQVHLYPPCDENETAVFKRVKWLNKEYQRRQKVGKDYAILFVLDELNAIFRRASEELTKELAELLLTLAQEGRKFNIYTMLIGQRWANQDITTKYGAAIRSSLSSVLAHRFTDENQAKLLLGSKNGPRCLELQQGHYLFRDTHGTLTETITPNTVESDGVVIQRQLAETTTENSEETTENMPKTVRKQYAELPAGGQKLLPESAENSAKTEKNTDELGENTRVIEIMMRVLEMQADGKNKPEIIKAIWCVSPGASEAYKIANNEYQQVLKIAYQRLG